MEVYHGSYLEVPAPDINYGRFNLDFGRGFYVTALKGQAEKWAHRRALMVKETPCVSVYEFDPDRLHVLSFDGYTEEWLDFVVQNRAGLLKSQSYDAVYGSIANDDVASIVNDYIRLLEMGRINDTAKQFYLGQLQYSEPNNQYCLITQKAVNALRFSRSYELKER